MQIGLGVDRHRVGLAVSIPVSHGSPALGQENQRTLAGGNSCEHGAERTEDDHRVRLKRLEQDVEQHPRGDARQKRSWKSPRRHHTGHGSGPALAAVGFGLAEHTQVVPAVRTGDRLVHSRCAPCTRRRLATARVGTSQLGRCEQAKRPSWAVSLLTTGWLRPDRLAGPFEGPVTKIHRVHLAVHRNRSKHGDVESVRHRCVVAGARSGTCPRSTAASSTVPSERWVRNRRTSGAPGATQRSVNATLNCPPSSSRVMAAAPRASCPVMVAVANTVTLAALGLHLGPASAGSTRSC